MSRGTSVAASQFRTAAYRGIDNGDVAASASLRTPNGAGNLRQEDSVAKEDRGFASMDRSKQREIASKGGKAAHQKGTAHEWTSEEAREAGRKGGMASHRRRKGLTETPEQSGGGGTDMSNMTSSDIERSGGDDTNEQIR
jgi:general stress protein YciG